MASVTRDNTIGGKSTLHSWTLTTADHTGDAIEMPGAPDRTIQFEGTWGGATAKLEGSMLEAGPYVPLNSAASGSAISATTDATGLAAVVENPRFIRPRLTTVGAGATIRVKLLSRSA